MSRVVDVAFGVTLLWAVVLGIARSPLPNALGIVLMALQVLVATLFLVRRAPRREASWRQRAVCLLSVPLPMLALSMAPPIPSWPLHAVLLLAIGGVGAGLSLAALGRSFGVLPAVRGIVERGPYDLVRHPAYANELVMVLACALAAPTVATSALAVVTVVLVVVRIRIEEQVLRFDARYGDYAQRVRFRLVPLLW